MMMVMFQRTRSVTFPSDTSLPFLTQWMPHQLQESAVTQEAESKMEMKKEPKLMVHFKNVHLFKMFIFPQNNCTQLPLS